MAKKHTTIIMPRMGQALQASPMTQQFAQNPAQAMNGKQPSPLQVEEAQHVAGNIILNDGSMQAIGGISNVQGFTPTSQFLTLIFANAGGTPETYRFGSELGAELAGTSGLSRATGGSTKVTAMYRAFEARPKIVKEIHYGTSSTKNQFSQNFKYFPGTDAGGSSKGDNPFPFAIAGRPTYDDDLLRIIAAKGIGWRFGVLEQAQITVLAGETVTLGLVLAGIEDR